jgi:hypothetical protein
MDTKNAQIVKGPMFIQDEIGDIIKFRKFRGSVACSSVN